MRAYSTICISIMLSLVLQSCVFGENTEQEPQTLKAIIDHERDLLDQYARMVIHRPVLKGANLVKDCKGIRVWNGTHIYALDGTCSDFSSIMDWISKHNFVQDEFPWNKAKSDIASRSILLFAEVTPQELPPVPIPQTAHYPMQGYITIPLLPETMGVTASEFETQMNELMSLITTPAAFQLEAVPQKTVSRDSDCRKDNAVKKHKHKAK